mmetsp:Transcript_64335/g.149687  ORF Transcript_64335/g.149687 Transcript_64335/m.149687 type:complete len:205 (-) Transcript_64335:956-1570(-)
MNLARWSLTSCAPSLAAMASSRCSQSTLVSCCSPADRRSKFSRSSRHSCRTRAARSHYGSATSSLSLPERTAPLKRMSPRAKLCCCARCGMPGRAPRRAMLRLASAARGASASANRRSARSGVATRAAQAPRLKVRRPQRQDTGARATGVGAGRGVVAGAVTATQTTGFPPRASQRRSWRGRQRTAATGPAGRRPSARRCSPQT